MAVRSLPALARILALAASVSAAAAQTVTPEGRFTWVTDAVVGLSGLHVSDGGQRFTAISDRGWIVQGRFDRIDGRITGVVVEDLLPILGNDGMPVAARRVGDWSDAEGLAVAPDGGCWMSFERWAHVAYYPGCGGAGQWIRDHPDFAALADNRQLEALAVTPDGTLYTFPEEPQDTGFPIYRLDAAGWVVAGHIPQADGFAITGADFDDRGRLYLLERKLVMGLWWQNRLRRLAAVTAPGAADILWTGGQGEYGNLEGISVWRDGVRNGAGLRLTLMSDDNGDRNEPTEFVEFRLEGAP